VVHSDALKPASLSVDPVENHAKRHASSARAIASAIRFQWAFSSSNINPPTNVDAQRLIAVPAAIPAPTIVEIKLEVRTLKLEVKLEVGSGK
jgi:hypothetical protein